MSPGEIAGFAVLGKRLRGILTELLLERGHLSFPFAPIQSGLCHACVLRARAPVETLADVKVLVVGSGGREHALVRALSRSPLLTELHAAPGNPGIAGLASCHPARADDPAAIAPLAFELGVDLVVVGPEAPLVAGLADELRSRGVAVFGPSAGAARIEGSKTFAKEVMDAAGVPSARLLDEARAPCVVKADGLTAGKGVWVCRTRAELDDALRAVEALDQPFHVEELLEGGEVSVFALCDGSRALPLASAQDYKRLGDDDAGPNTGGMGAFSPRLPADDVSEIVETVHMPVLAELAQRRTPFLGTLYAGLMLTEDGPRVLEFNCRFGDPETQVVLPLVEGDLLESLAAAAAGDVRGLAMAPSSRSAVVVVLAGRDYPQHGDSGTPIDGVEAAERAGAVVLHAATALHDGQLVTNGGRILNVAAVADTVADARAAAYDAVAHIDFAGMRYRSDIARDA